MQFLCNFGTQSPAEMIIDRADLRIMPRYIFFLSLIFEMIVIWSFSFMFLSAIVCLWPASFFEEFTRKKP